MGEDTSFASRIKRVSAAGTGASSALALSTGQFAHLSFSLDAAVDDEEAALARLAGEFPRDSAFPSMFGQLESLMGQVTDCYQVPFASTYCTAMTVVAHMCAGRVRYAANHTHNWITHPTFYYAGMRPPGGLKSPELDTFMIPLERHAKARKSAYEREVDEAKQEVFVIQEDLKRLNAALAGKARYKAWDVGGGSAEEAGKVLSDDEVRARRALRTVELRVWQRAARRDLRNWVSDGTTESLGPKVLHNNDEIGAVITTEAQSLKNWCGHFSGGQSNMELLNKAYDGEPHSICRADPEKPTLNFDVPLLTIAMLLQTGIALPLFMSRDAVESGLTARFWLMRFPNKAGDRVTSANATPFVPSDSRVFQEYEAACRRILSVPILEDRSGVPILQLSDQASDFRDECEALTIRSQGVGGAFNNDILQSWASKEITREVKLAGNLYVLERAWKGEDPFSGKIPERCLRAARAVGEYAAKHFLAIFGERNQSSTSKDEHKVMRKALDRGIHVFALSKVYNDFLRTNQACADPRTARAVCDSLRMAGALCLVPGTIDMYQVNPILIERHPPKVKQQG